MQQVIDSDGRDPAALQVTSTHTTESTGLWRVEVAVTYPFETVVPWPLLPNQVNLRRAVVMRGIR
jgi:hypothetical protein